jgi:hypothetical protein
VTKTLAVALMMLVAWISAPVVAAEKVAVFVTSSGASPGVTDPNKDNQDAAADLAALVDDQPELKTVDRREDAKIVLVVQSCEYTSAPENPARKSRIEAKFVFGKIESLLAGVGNVRVPGIDQEMLRALAARAVARQVNDWVRGNREKID